MKRLAAVSNLSGRAESGAHATDGGVVVAKQSTSQDTATLGRQMGLRLCRWCGEWTKYGECTDCWGLRQKIILRPDIARKMLAADLREQRKQIEKAGAIRTGKLKPAKAKGAKR